MAFGVLFEMPFFALSGKQNLKQQLKITGITSVSQLVNTGILGQIYFHYSLVINVHFFSFSAVMQNM